MATGSGAIVLFSGSLRGYCLPLPMIQAALGAKSNRCGENGKQGSKPEQKCVSRFEHLSLQNFSQEKNTLDVLHSAPTATGIPMSRPVLFTGKA